MGLITDPTGLETVAWIPSWHLLPKEMPIDGLEIVNYQTLKVANPNDMIGRGGVGYLSAPDPNGGLSVQYEARWLRGEDILAIIANNPGIGWTGGTLTEAHGVAVADWFCDSGLWYGVIGTEFEGEGDLRDQGLITDFMNPFTNGFARRMKERYTTAGKTLRLKAAYGGFHLPRVRVQHGFKVSGTPTSPEDSYFTSPLASQSAARATAPFFSENIASSGPAKYLDEYEAADVKCYVEDFKSARIAYDILYACALTLRALDNGDGTYRNDYWLHFWAKSEAVESPKKIQNNIQYTRTVGSPAGKVRSSAHPHADYDLMELVSLLSMTYKAKQWLWAESELYGSNPSYMIEPNPVSRPEKANIVAWESTAGAVAPYNPNIPGYPEYPNGWRNIPSRAKDKYNKTAATAGQTWTDCEYQVTERLGSTGFVAVSEISVTISGTANATICKWANMHDGYWPGGTGFTAANLLGARTGGRIARCRYRIEGSTMYVSIVTADPSYDKCQAEKIKFKVNGHWTQEYVLWGTKGDVIAETISI